ncbi:MAG: hypothetical protein M0037_05280 [Betaproteobacteria bacterium]|nr:hypothetical protein [Betaproteobacteria bacterium]
MRPACPLCSARAFLGHWLRFVAAIVGAVALINATVDPYGLYRFVTLTGFNRIKPEAENSARLVKAYALEHMRPRALIVGNSRVEVGLDPRAPAWPTQDRPVYNLGLPGTGPYIELRYLQDALAVHRPKLVVLGVDFMDFLVNPDAKASFPPPRGHYERRLLVNYNGTPNRARYLQQAQDTAATLFSLNALTASAKTLVAQWQAYPANMTRRGFNPMADYAGFVHASGHYPLFLQRDTENMKDYVNGPKGLTLGRTGTSPAFEALWQMIELCRVHHIKLVLIIYPYHAHLLETFKATGLWPQFEAWKKRVVDMVALDARMHPSQQAFALWDFSGYNRLTDEAIPPEGSTRPMRWYWESGHFKKALGNLMLDRIFGRRPPFPLPNGFGVRLGPRNIDSRLAAIRLSQRRYEATHAQDVAEIARLARAASSGTRPGATMTAGHFTPFIF